MLTASVRRVIRAPVDACLECLMRPDNFFSKSRYTYFVKKISEDTYEVVFKWRKWGMTRYYRVVLKMKRKDGEVVYESTEDSDYWFRMEFKLRKRDDATELDVETSMKAGLMADLLGKGDYRVFVEELVDRGIKGFLEALAETIQRQVAAPRTPGKPSCRSCALYEESRSYCYYLEAQVENPDEPPCKGRGYIGLPPPTQQPQG